MVDYLVSDVIVQSGSNIAASKVDSIDAVRRQTRPLISLSEPALGEHQELKRFLRSKLYNHPKVMEVMGEARATLKVLFEAYFADPSRLPPEHQALVARADAEGGTPARARVVADYVAGMTDRFAFVERERLSA
jgi:dGTPase